MVLDQVKEAFQPSPGGLKPRAIVTYNLQGQKVFSSHALIPILDWAVFVERPVEDAYEPLYASMLRTSSLLLVGLGLALLASLYLARRVVRPLQALREGVERISSGDLSSRLEIKTGDEIETLAEEFNKMTAHLKEAQTGLERKVAERTQALTVANEKLEEASQLKSQFLANVNHELRTPVSAIIGYARLVLRATEGQISQLQRENLQDLLQQRRASAQSDRQPAGIRQDRGGQDGSACGTGQGERGYSGSHLNHRTDLERWQCSNHSRNRSRHSGR